MSDVVAPATADSSQPAPVATKPRLVLAPLNARLRKLLYAILFLFALLSANSLYLIAVRAMEWWSGLTYQNYFFLQMFLLHLVLGFLLIVPLAWFLVGHIPRVYRHKNRRAVRAGYGLMLAAILLIVTGVILMRVEGVIEINQPQIRSVIFWLHVGSPLLVIWLYVLHRLAGRRIRWKIGGGWLLATGLFIGAMLGWHQTDPRRWNTIGPKSGERYFFPSLARTSTGNFIPASVLNNDLYCQECHREAHQSWLHSAHRMSSFNNPAYLFSVKNTRQEMMKRHGHVGGSRFCAGCHDPVPFLSGAFDDPKFDDPNYDLASDVFAQAGITCTTCHAISHINDVRGNGSYTVDEPINYPFTDSSNSFLRWVSRQLVKAKPQFHKQSMLKPLHRTTEFCGACHKVHLPPELNDYKWLRGQNHYDSFWLSGVSGHNVESFYYPPRAETNCNGCHMPLKTVAHSGAEPNFAARIRDDSNELKTFDHQFPAANTALPQLLRDQLPDADRAIARHQEYLQGIVRVDLFGIRESGRLEGALWAPLDEVQPRLRPGQSYLLETVVRTLKIGHFLTQGTADSNEVWLDVSMRLNDQVIGRSGGLDPQTRSVDPWSHFLNAFVIDRNGFRINRRNAEDIFVALYDNQIPPGAAATVHYQFQLPESVTGELELIVRLQYRKFDTEYMRLVAAGNGGKPDPHYQNPLTITTLAEDRLVLQVAHEGPPQTGKPKSVPAWQRWNDYGIGLFLRGQFRQAEEAFARVESLGMPDGPVNLARVYLREGRVAEEAPQALRRAEQLVGPAGERVNSWTLLWLAGLVAKQNGELEAARDNFLQVYRGGFAQAAGRGFEFHKDYRLLNELGDTYYLLAAGLRDASQRSTRTEHLQDAKRYFQEALQFDPENMTAHYGLQRVCWLLGEGALSRDHGLAHQKYKLDDNVRDFAVAEARRRYPAANLAAEQVVIYDLQRPAGLEPNAGLAPAEPGSIQRIVLQKLLEPPQASNQDPQ